MSTSSQQVTTLPRRLKLRSRGGCMECKLRKRKCDEIRPSCGPCRRLKHECQWLDQLSPEEQREFSERQKHRSKKVELVLRDTTPAHPEIVQQTLVADHSNVRASFLIHQLFGGANNSSLAGDGEALSIHSELHFAGQRSSLTWSCLNAMAMVYWGQTHHNNAMIAQGYKDRGVSLARLRDALQSDVASFNGDVLAAVSLARSFEAMLPDAKSQWIIHAQGLAQLFQAMGPHAFKTPAMRRLVENNRWVMIASSSVRRKPTPLNTKAWKTVPWEGAHKDMVQEGLDFYARVPSIHVAWDKYLHASNEEEKATAAEKCVAELQNILLEMHNWRQSVDSEIEQSVRPWEPISTTASCPWRQTVQFSKIHHAYAIVLFNKVIILLSLYISRFPQAANIIEGPLPQQTSSSLLHGSLLPLDSPFKRAAIAADEIAAIIPWSTQESFRGGGSMYMAAPALIIDQFWQKVDPQKAIMFAPTLHYINSTWNSLIEYDHQMLQ